MVRTPRKKRAPAKAKRSPVTNHISAKNERAIRDWKQRIEKSRKDQRLSQRKLAEIAGLGPTSVRHIVTDAETITLKTLAQLASALGVTVEYLAVGQTATIEGGDGDHKNIRIIPIMMPDDEVGKPPKEDNGYVCLQAKGLPADVCALKVTNEAMMEERVNEPVSPRAVVLPGDVVVFSSSVPSEPGDLVVAPLPFGRQTTLNVRRFSVGDDGECYLLANHHAFGRVKTTPEKVSGRVLSIVRSLR